MTEVASTPEAAATAANTSAIPAAILPPIGTEFAGGFFGGLVKVGDDTLAVIWAPKALGQARKAWLPSYTQIPGTDSRSDSVANTKAMVAASSPAALFATALTINGFSDWVVPARDVLELAYRHFKPTTDENYADGIDGVNESSVPLGEAYTDEFPKQTQLELFAEGGAEAFDAAWYWSSTQSTQFSDYGAWNQGFNHGSQNDYDKKFEGAVRAVRMVQVTA
jgi:hypothetical protein